MLRLWASVLYIGTGTDDDPFRPDMTALDGAVDMDNTDVNPTGLVS